MLLVEKCIVSLGLIKTDQPSRSFPVFYQAQVLGSRFLDP